MEVVENVNNKEEDEVDDQTVTNVLANENENDIEDKAELDDDYTTHKDNEIPNDYEHVEVLVKKDVPVNVEEKV